MLDDTILWRAQHLHDYLLAKVARETGINDHRLSRVFRGVAPIRPDEQSRIIAALPGLAKAVEAIERQRVATSVGSSSTASGTRAPRCCCGAGQPVRVVSERLGHSKVQMTLDTYTHVLPDMQQGAAAALGRCSTADSQLPNSYQTS